MNEVYVCIRCTALLGGAVPRVDVPASQARGFYTPYASGLFNAFLLFVICQKFVTLFP
jgi:hypothetical protein